MAINQASPLPSPSGTTSHPTDETTSHPTNQPAEELLAGHPKDGCQVVGYKPASGQVAGYLPEGERDEASLREFHVDRSNQTGFTLIEVLVVLIIVGMVSGVLFQALERAYRLQERFGIELFSVQQGQMAADWYRQTVQGLHPDYPDGRSIFQGNDREFSGITSNPLSNEYGVPTPITWKIRNNQQNGTTELAYIEEKRETPVLTWRGNQARFIYLDEQQTPHDSWPPPLGVSTQLPKQIQLVAKNAGEPVSIIASVMGPVMPLMRAQDALGIIP